MFFDQRFYLFFGIHGRDYSQIFIVFTEAVIDKGEYTNTVTT